MPMGFKCPPPQKKNFLILNSESYKVQKSWKAKIAERSQEILWTAASVIDPPMLETRIFVH